MKLFKNKSKNKKETKVNAEFLKVILEQALKENKGKEDKIKILNHNMEILIDNSEELRDKNLILNKNIETLINTNEVIKSICRRYRTSKVSKEILKELGE